MWLQNIRSWSTGKKLIFILSLSRHNPLLEATHTCHVMYLFHCLEQASTNRRTQATVCSVNKVLSKTVMSTHIYFIYGSLSAKTVVLKVVPRDPWPAKPKIFMV